jgi:glutamate-1-semialdehyde 2,1-aminomutase
MPLSDIPISCFGVSHATAPLDILERAAFASFFRAMLGSGIYIAPSQFKAWFVSTAHGKAEVAATLEAADRACAAVARGPESI